MAPVRGEGAMGNHDGDPGRDNDSSAPKGGMPRWLVVVLVLGALVVLCGGASLFGAVSILVPRIQEKQAQTTCANHLRQLGGIFTSVSLETRGPPPYSGPALLMHYRQKRYIQATREEVLTCPNDPIARPPSTHEEVQAYDMLDLKKSVRPYVSFAVRDFAKYPLSGEVVAAQPIMACIHHESGVNILYDDGGVRFMTHDDLGLEPGESVTVGSDAESELLRTLTMTPTSEE